MGETEDEETIKEGKIIIESMAALKYEMQHDRKLTCVALLSSRMSSRIDKDCRPLVNDGQSDIEGYNKESQDLGALTWFNAPWLYAECYLYR